MTAGIRRLISSASWCGVLILCFAICFQLLGAPGTLFNFADSEDDFQASVMLGYTIASGTVSVLPRPASTRASIEIPSTHTFLASYTLFHPPLFVCSLVS